MTEAGERRAVVPGGDCACVTGSQSQRAAIGGAPGVSFRTASVAGTSRAGAGSPQGLTQAGAASIRRRIVLYDIQQI